MQKASNEGFFLAARSGQAAVSDLTHRGKINAFDRELQNRDVLESYVPLRQGDGPVEAVIELYSDVTPLVHRINQLERNLLVGLIAAFGLIYGGLFLIVWRGNVILKRQYEDVLYAREMVRRAAAGATARNELFLRRISSELHDGPAQNLSLAMLRLDSISGPLKKGLTQITSSNAF